jgi:Mor family transcriptional regulator
MSTKPTRMTVIFNGYYVKNVSVGKNDLDAKEIFVRCYRGEKIKDIFKDYGLSKSRAHFLRLHGRYLMIKEHWKHS